MILTIVIWGFAALLVLFVVGIVVGWIVGAMRDRQQDREEQARGESGASDEFADELHVMVVEASIDRTLGNTDEIDMTELHTRLALEDAEIEANKKTRALVDEAVATLLDDETWAKYLIKRKESSNV